MLFFRKERVCCFAHPVEALFETDKDPGIGRWPALVLKVCSSDLQGNEVCEGYTWISLHDLCPGNKDTLLKTWKPQSTKTRIFQSLVLFQCLCSKRSNRSLEEEGVK